MVCCSVPYFKQLANERKQLFRELTVVHDPKRQLGLIHAAWQPKFGEIYGEEVLREIQKNRETREVFNALNMESENKEKFAASRGIMNNHKLVPDHPLGVEGLFFSPYEIHGFIRKGELYEHSEELFNELWNDYVCNEQYIYKHTWQEGDIVLFDQVIGIHRRPDILKDKPRRLLRTATWYKSHLRKHHNYVV